MRIYVGALNRAVRNTSNQSLFVTAISNLSQQCFVFLDSELSSPAQEFRIDSQQLISVFVVLQPMVSTSSNNQSSNKDQQLECRQLIGGLRFLVHVREDPSESTLFHLLTQVKLYLIKCALLKIIARSGCKV